MSIKNIESIATIYHVEDFQDLHTAFHWDTLQSDKTLNSTWRINFVTNKIYEIVL